MPRVGALGDVAPVRDRRALGRRGVMSTALSPSSDTDPSVAVERSVIRGRMLLVDLERHVDLVADEVDRLDGADLDAGDAHRRSGLEPRHVGELRLQVVALPEEAAGAGQQEDRQRRR